MSFCLSSPLNIDYNFLLTADSLATEYQNHSILNAEVNDCQAIFPGFPALFLKTIWSSSETTVSKENGTYLFWQLYTICCLSYRLRSCGISIFFLLSCQYEEKLIDQFSYIHLLQSAKFVMESSSCIYFHFELILCSFICIRTPIKLCPSCHQNMNVYSLQKIYVCSLLT